jgi:hypothetical protein
LIDIDLNNDKASRSFMQQQWYRERIIVGTGITDSSTYVETIDADDDDDDDDALGENDDMLHL